MLAPIRAIRPRPSFGDLHDPQPCCRPLPFHGPCHRVRQPAAGAGCGPLQADRPARRRCDSRPPRPALSRPDPAGGRRHRHAPAHLSRQGNHSRGAGRADDAADARMAAGQSCAARPDRKARRPHHHRQWPAGAVGARSAGRLCLQDRRAAGRDRDRRILPVPIRDPAQPGPRRHHPQDDEHPVGAGLALSRGLFHSPDPGAGERHLPRRLRCRIRPSLPAAISIRSTWATM